MVETGTERPPTNAALSGARPRATVRLLVVDDDPGFGHLVVALLDEAGYDHVELVATRRAAVEASTPGRFDVLLVDYHLGDGTGVEVLSEIRARGCEAPVVVLTGRADVDLEVLRAGATDHLAKDDVRPESLDRCVRHALERAAMVEEVERARAAELRMRDEFVSHISHELRTPLAAIGQFTSILADGLAADPDEEQRFFGIVKRNVRQLATMVDELLDVTRLERPGFSVLAHRVDLGDVIERAVAAMRPAAAEGGLVLDAPMGAHPVVIGDPDRLVQVLTNLVDNAIKFTPAGGRVTVEVGAPRDGLVEVGVLDTGPGLDPDAAERVFNRLHQEQTSVHRSRRGLGLGLHICRQLVERHGGRIWAEASPTGGTAMRFTLPSFDLRRTIEPLVSDRDEPVEGAIVEIVGAGQDTAGKASQHRSALDELAGPDVVVLPPLGEEHLGVTHAVVAVPLGQLDARLVVLTDALDGLGRVHVRRFCLGGAGSDAAIDRVLERIASA